MHLSDFLHCFIFSVLPLVLDYLEHYICHFVSYDCLSAANLEMRRQNRRQGLKTLYAILDVLMQSAPESEDDCEQTPPSLRDSCMCSRKGLLENSTLDGD
jgi:hypothetical protein